MSETGELIAKAEIVLSLLFNREGDGVVLFALLVIHNLTTWGEKAEVNVKVTPTDHLKGYSKQIIIVVNLASGTKITKLFPAIFVQGENAFITKLEIRAI